MAFNKTIKQIPNLQYALDQSSMVLVLDKDRRIVSANELFCATTQYTEPELLGKSFDMTDPDYHSRWFLKQLWDTVEAGEVWKGELKNKTKLGTNYWTDTVIVPIQDNADKPEEYIVLQHDISSKKVIQEEVEEINEAEFAKLYQQQQHYIAEIEERSAEWERYFQISVEMIVVFNYDGVLTRINPAFRKALGYSPKELHGQHFSKFVHKDDLEEAYRQYENLKEGREVVGFENRWKNYNGEYLWMSWQAIMDPETKYLYCVSRDITTQKDTQSRIRDFTHTLNQTTSVIVLDEKQRITSVNQKFCEISGYQTKEVLNQPYHTLQLKYQNKSFWKDVQASIQRGKIWQGEVCEQTKNGRKYWTYTSIVPFPNENGIPAQYIITQSDITNRKNLEDKLREAKEEADKNAKIKENFLANMSHEIRTPMNGVLGFSRLLLQTDMNTTQHEYAQSIYSSAENLLVIVNDILDVSKIESGTFQLHEIPFNLKKRIEEGLSILKLSVQRKNLDFSIDIDETIPPIIMGVPDRLSQILINLVGNAIKFTKEGYVRLSVTIKNNYLIFQVKDSGIGIPSDKLDTIFESFTQAENYTTREYSGTGLGLSISRKLVNVMGGQIGVESVLGEGSTFYFTLPYREANAEIAATESLSDEATHAAEAPLILIVEDNTVNQELTQIYLNLLECNYHIAYNGEEALDCIRHHDYDLILMDIQMPKMDGMAATVAIRKINDHVPILAMSAHALEREREKCFEIGMNDYLAKPFKVEALKEILEQFIVLPAQKICAAQPRVQHLNSQELEEDLARNKFLKITEASISHELLLLFRQELDSLQKGMEEALKEADLATIQQLMHKIKSNFQLLDLTKFYEWSVEIDQLAMQGAPIKEIEHLYQQFKEALLTLLTQMDDEIGV